MADQNGIASRKDGKLTIGRPQGGLSSWFRVKIFVDSIIKMPPAIYSERSE
jgi:hypothetical protein